MSARPFVADMEAAHAVEPGEGALDDVADLAQAYDAHYAGLSEQFAARLAQITSPDADPAEAAAETVVNRLGGLVRTAFHQRTGLDDLLGPR